MPIPELPPSGEESHADLQPLPLPPELAEFLAEVNVACLFHATNHGTALVVKLPQHDIASIRGQVPIQLRHELYAHPAAPVIRTIVTVHDRPQSPLALEIYTHVQDSQQRTGFAALIAQDRP